MYLAGARYSNYGQWLDQPTIIGPGAQPVPRTVPGLPMIVQDVVNADLGGGFAFILVAAVTIGLYHR